MRNASSSNGFAWKKTMTLVTKGIMMWSEIFTHDYENGTKVAIILWDTQGLSHSETSTRDVALVSALTTVLSSVQCLNLEKRFDRVYDLHYFELFYGYSQITLNQTNAIGKPLQNLVFIVRDYDFSNEKSFGWHKLKEFESKNQTKDYHETLKRLTNTFDDVKVFLMPHPGQGVRNDNYTGDVSVIDREFRNQLTVLIPRILNPENLVIKKINGENLKIRDLAQSIRIYFNCYNTNKNLLRENLLEVSHANPDNNKCLWSLWTFSVFLFVEYSSAQDIFQNKTVSHTDVARIVG